MKKLAALALCVLVLLSACGKKDNDGFELLTIPDGAKVSLLDTKDYDVLSYARDDADVESLLKEINKVKREEVTQTDFIDYKNDTPFVCIYIEIGEEQTTYIFKVFAMGENKCAAIMYTVGADQDIYDVEFENEKIAELTKKIYSGFEDKQ